MTSRLVTPGSTTTQPRSTSTSSTRVIRASEITIPSATGSAPPESPDPAPRATNGIPSAAHTRTTAGDLAGALRKRDRDGHDAAARETVALVGPQLLGPGDQLVLAQQLAQLFESPARPHAAV